MPLKETDKPIIISPDGEIRIDTSLRPAIRAKKAISGFTELKAVGETFEVREINSRTVAAAYDEGYSHGSVVNVLDRYTRYGVPGNVKTHIQDYFEKLGKAFIRFKPDGFSLFCTDPISFNTILRSLNLKKLFEGEPKGKTWRFPLKNKERIKTKLLKIGLPVADLSLPKFKTSLKNEFLKQEITEYRGLGKLERASIGDLVFSISAVSLWEALDNNSELISELRLLIPGIDKNAAFKYFLADVISRYAQIFIKPHPFGRSQAGFGFDLIFHTKGVAAFIKGHPQFKTSIIKAIYKNRLTLGVIDYFQSKIGFHVAIMRGEKALISPKLACENCATINIETARYCKNCGVPLDSKMGKITGPR